MSVDDLVLALLLGCRVRGIGGFDGDRLHRALAAFLASRGGEVRRLCWSVPAPHPLFGTYHDLDEALDELGRAGALSCEPPTWRTFSFDVTPEDAERLTRKLAGDVPAELLEAFAASVRREGAGRG